MSNETKTARSAVHVCRGKDGTYYYAVHTDSSNPDFDALVSDRVFTVLQEEGENHRDFVKRVKDEARKRDIMNVERLY